MDDLKELERLLLKANFIFWDTETSGLRVKYPGNDYGVGYTFAVEDELDKRVFYIPVAHLFEGKYVSHINLEKLGINIKDFPGFTEKQWIGNSYHNMDVTDVNKMLRRVFEHSRINKVIKKVRITDSDFGEVSCGKVSPIRIAHHQAFDWHVLADIKGDTEKVMKNINYDDTQIMCHTRWEEELKKLE